MGRIPSLVSFNMLYWNMKGSRSNSKQLDFRNGYENVSIDCFYTRDEERKLLTG